MPMSTTCGRPDCGSVCRRHQHRTTNSWTATARGDGCEVPEVARVFQIGLPSGCAETPYKTVLPASWKQPFLPAPSAMVPVFERGSSAVRHASTMVSWLHGKKASVEEKVARCFFKATIDGNWTREHDVHFHYVADGGAREGTTIGISCSEGGFCSVWLHCQRHVHNLVRVGHCSRMVTCSLSSLLFLLRTCQWTSRTPRALSLRAIRARVLHVLGTVPPDLPGHGSGGGVSRCYPMTLRFGSVWRYTRLAGTSLAWGFRLHQVHKRRRSVLKFHPSRVQSGCLHGDMVKVLGAGARRPTKPLQRKPLGGIARQ